jgi:hypothetical protein
VPGTAVLSDDDVSMYSWSSTGGIVGCNEIRLDAPCYTVLYKRIVAYVDMLLSIKYSVPLNGSLLKETVPLATSIAKVFANYDHMICLVLNLCLALSYMIVAL